MHRVRRGTCVIKGVKVGITHIAFQPTFRKGKGPCIVKDQTSTNIHPMEPLDALNLQSSEVFVTSVQLLLIKANSFIGVFISPIKNMLGLLKKLASLQVSSHGRKNGILFSS